MGDDFAVGEKQTIFNEAFALINRVNSLITIHHKAILSKEYETALTCLDLFYVEISPKLNDKEKGIIEEKRRKADEEVDKILEELSKQGNSVKKRAIMLPKTTIKGTKKALHEYMEVIKHYQDKKGLGVPDKASPHDALFENK